LLIYKQATMNQIIEKILLNSDDTLNELQRECEDHKLKLESCKNANDSHLCEKLSIVIKLAEERLEMTRFLISTCRAIIFFKETYAEHKNAGMEYIAANEGTKYDMAIDIFNETVMDIERITAEYNFKLN